MEGKRIIVLKFDFKKSKDSLRWMNEANGEVRDHYLFQISILEDLRSDVRALCIVIWKYKICIGIIKKEKK